MLANLVLDGGRLSRMMSEKMVLRPTCINTLQTDTFSLSAFLTWSVSFAFGNTTML